MEKALSCLFIEKDDLILKCSHSEGNFEIPFSHVIEDKWYNMFMGNDFIAVISDHLMLSESNLNLVKIGGIAGEIY